MGTLCRFLLILKSDVTRSTFYTFRIIILITHSLDLIFVGVSYMSILHFLLVCIKLIRFVRGKKPGRNTGFDMDEIDLAAMEQCYGVVVASAIFGICLHNGISTNHVTCVS